MALVALAYTGAAEIGFSLAFATKQVTAVWPPTGIALAALLIRGPKVWPGILLGAFASNALSHESLLTASGIAIGNTLAPLAGYYMLQRFLNFDCGLRRIRDVAGLAALGGVAAMLISASNGVANLAMAGIIPWAAIPSVWWVWWVGDAMGVLLLTPVLLAWFIPSSNTWTRAKVFELLLAVFTLTLVSVIFFSSDLPLAYPIFPIVIWIALRFGQRESTTAVLLASAIAVWQTIHERGPFTSGSFDARLGMLVTFMAVLAITGLALGVLVSERRRAEASLRQANEDLEARVVARTAQLHEDMAKRKVADERLKESEERFRKAFETAAHGMALVSTEGKWLKVNKAICDIVGYTEEELLLLDFQTITHPDDLESDLAQVNALLVGKIDSYHMEKRYLHKAGYIVWIVLSVSLVRDVDGQPLHFVSQVLDISQRKKAEQALVLAKEAADDANQAKALFLANMSHEIRTPMNAIIGFSDLLIDSALSPEQSRQLTLVRDAAHALLAIINDILDISKIEAGHLQLEHIPLNLFSTVDGTVSIIRGQATSKGLTLRTDLPVDLPSWIAGDPTRLRQVLINLLSNAVKFTTEGSITLRVRQDAQHSGVLLRFEVSDTGAGIPADRQHQLFKNFSQIGRSTARRHGGTGLGLSISKLLVEAMGGDIGVQSEEGVGSLFWFTVQLTTADAPQTVKSGPKRAAKAARLLLVEDIEANRLLAQALLATAGHSVTIAKNGIEALAALSRAEFDLVLMDVEMPEMDGIEATQAIRKLSSHVRNIPIVALTANAMVDEVERCKRAGMNDHLAKPINRDKLLNAVDKWSQGNRATH